MSVSSLGRRFERLLFFAGPLAVASVLVMFVALASEHQDERKRAKCLRSVADVLSLNRDVLDQAWRGKPVVVRGRETTSYWLTTRHTLIPWEVENVECLKHYPPFDIDEKIPAPKILIEKALKEASALEEKPISLYGIELPERASINVFGTPIKMSSTTLARVMQVALAPMLLLWLGSLYNTRHRESLLIGRMKDVGALYPHLINVYPVMIVGDPTWDPPRKKSWGKFVFLSYGVPAIYSLTRISLLSTFVGPPVAFYLLSVYFLRDDIYSVMFIAMGLIVGLFALGTFFCEIFPWHISKKFRVAAAPST